MSSPTDSLSKVYLEVAAQQVSLSNMLQDLKDASLSLGDLEKQAAQIQSDIGKAVVNTRDTIVGIMRAQGVSPSAIFKIQSLQALTDSKGTYLHDEKGNFIIR